MIEYRAIVGLVVLAAMNLGSGWLGYQVSEGKHGAVLLAKKAAEDAALNAAAAAIAKIEVRSETHVQPIRTEIRTNTVYRDCSHSADSLRHLDALITGSEPAGGGVVSGAKPAR